MKANEQQTGWHRADIIAAVRKKGSNLRRLGLAQGFAESTLRSSLHRRHPRAHAVIATFLGVPRAELWPQWYASEGPRLARPQTAKAAASRRVQSMGGILT